MKKRHGIFLISFCFILSSIALHAQETDDAKSGEWLKTISGNAIPKPAGGGKYAQAHPGFALYFSQAGKISVPYIVYVPRGYDPSHPAAMVVYLHGAILARDSFQYKRPGIADEPVFSVGDTFSSLVVFPFARADFAWGRQDEACRNVLNIIEQTGKLYNVDKKKIYIGGISMGGNATYWFVKNKPEVFAGFYAFSSLPKDVQFDHINAERPLYTMNAKDDHVFAYTEVAAEYEKYKKKVDAWHFYSVDAGGHRFIYQANGSAYVQQLVGNLMAAAKH